MRSITVIAAAAVAFLAAAGSLRAATPATEQAFLTAFKAAAQAKDLNAMKALIHTDGVSRTMLDFYLMVLTSDFASGGEVSVELKPLNADDLADAGRAMTGPGGVLVKLGPIPYKKLVITIAVKGANGSSTSTSSVYVADEGDKIRIAAPMEVK
jgi:hypothetical protein